MQFCDQMYFSIITFQGIKMLCISAQHGDETLPCSLSQPTKCFLFITFQRICKALQPDLGLYFDFLEDSYKLRCISAGWHGGLRTLPCSHPKPTRYIHMHSVSIFLIFIKNL